MAVRQSDARAPRGPAFTHAALLAIMVLVFGLFLLRVPQQDGPPAIAEVVPQAVERILQAPVQQAVPFGKQSVPGGPSQGSGPGGGGGDGSGGPPTGAQSNVPLPPSDHQCVGNPPTQIDDPQSPPCVPYWRGNNGGATAPGVTATTINIALFDGGTADIINFFNTKFEFYGRKLNVISNDQGQFSGCDPNSQQAEAIQEVNSPGSIFAGLNLVCDTGDNYYKTLAQLHRMGVISYNPMYPQSFLQQNRPYLWQYPMGEDSELLNTGDWMCRRLQGKLAAHAKTSQSGTQTIDMSKQQRKFGVVVAPFDSNTAIDIGPLNRRLQGCGVTGQPEVVLGGNNSAQSVAAQMQQANVTSILCLCSYQNLAQFMANADSDKYFPEWLLTDFEANNYEYYIKNSGLPADQMTQMFGLTFMPREVRTVDDPSWKAYAEGSGGTAHAPSGSEDTAGTRVSFEQNAYRALLLLASGIQMAGPNLTYDSFEAALQRTQFPNPAKPINAGKVGFAGGSYSMTTDGAEWWWNASEPSPYGSDPPGTYCYIDRGIRHSVGDWPMAGDPFFTNPGACDHGP